MLSSRLLLQKAAFIKPNSSSARSLSTLIQSTNNAHNLVRPTINGAMIRSFSDLSVPKPPTSIHPHTPLGDAKGSLIYTETDEAPALATFSLLPILSKVSFAKDKKVKRQCKRKKSFATRYATVNSTECLTIIPLNFNVKVSKTSICFFFFQTKEFFMNYETT